MAGFSDGEILSFGLDACPDERVMEYVSQELMVRVLRPRLNGLQRHVLEDKWAAQAFLASIGVSVPKLYGVYHPCLGMAADGGPLTEAGHLAALLQDEMPCRLFLKPRGGRQGLDIRVAAVDRGADGVPVATTAEGKAPLPAFLAALPMEDFSHYDHSYQGWLVQRYIDQHPAVATFNPGTVNTVRVVTYRRPSGDVALHGAIFRTGRIGALGDNCSQGGIAVGVDLATGALQTAYTSLVGEAPERVEAHPDSGLAFAGVVLPDWPRSMEICRRAARAFSGVRWAGWDVAMAPEGPVMVEGNSDWSIAQQLVNGAYLTPERRAEMAAGVALPDRLPGLPRAAARLARRELRRVRRWALHG